MGKSKQEGHTPNSAAIIMVKSAVKNEENSVETGKQMEKINFSYSFRPIYYFSRVFGLMPFSITYDSNGEAQRPQIGIFDGIWFVFSMLIYSSSVYFIALKLMIRTSATFVVIVGNTFLLMSIIYGVGAVAMDMCFNRFKFTEIVKSFTVFDKQVNLTIPRRSFNFLNICNTSCRKT